MSFVDGNKRVWELADFFTLQQIHDIQKYVGDDGSMSHWSQVRQFVSTTALARAWDNHRMANPFERLTEAQRNMVIAMLPGPVPFCRFPSLDAVLDIHSELSASSEDALNLSSLGNTSIYTPPRGVHRTTVEVRPPVGQTIMFTELDVRADGVYMQLYCSVSVEKLQQLLGKGRAQDILKELSKAMEDRLYPPAPVSAPKVEPVQAFSVDPPIPKEEQVACIIADLKDVRETLRGIMKRSENVSEGGGALFGEVQSLLEKHAGRMVMSKSKARTRRN